MPALEESTASGRLTYRGDKWAACLNRIKTQSCDSAKMMFTLTDMAASCQDAFVPRVAVGGACMLSDECVNGYCLNATCAAKKPNGSACTNASECSAGECSETGACGPPAPAGGICPEMP